MIIKNEASYTISIKYRDIVIAPGHTGTVYEYHGQGGPGSNGYCEAGPGNIGTITAEVQSHPELELKKNLSDMNNWSYTKKGNGRKGFKIQCFCIIKDADIVPK
jgi:hypothetical protein